MSTCSSSRQPHQPNVTPDGSHVDCNHSSQPIQQQEGIQEEKKKKCTFYDMIHSNNAARIRVWLRLKGRPVQDQVRIVTIGHDELHNGSLESVNPLKKVPAFLTDTGLILFESFVILQYLEDRFGRTTVPSLVLDTTPEDRAMVQLMVRIHDIYISSPNCTQPHFSHTQGCMYLDEVPTKFTPEHRTMNVETRATKLAEIYKQLSWLETQARLPYLAGNQLTHADCTWFPTCIFMKLLLPLVFDWDPIFDETKHFPKLTQWFQKCLENESFAQTYQEIHGTLMKQHEEHGRFDKVRQVVLNNPQYKWKYM